MPQKQPTPKKNSPEISWEEAIKQVLLKNKKALKYTDIAEQISMHGLKSVANPSASVAIALSKSISSGSGQFVRLGGGLYTLTDVIKINDQPPEKDDTSQLLDDDADTGALKAFGMYWQREAVNWVTKPKLLGRQSEGATPVNFNEQVGVYLLHDRDRVIYVGRANDTLGARLLAHTTDRLGGRWDRFSWFGLRAVDDGGKLAAPSTAWSHEVVIETLEALLIETMEPPLNRRRGDNFAAVEYLQVSDPSIEDKRTLALIEDLKNRMLNK
ncbi:MAG: hypothetical protein KGQ52_06930 [Alphaproteobacteria bacterium]|nr:hypothetical protein [Alphaproteobacteria bacterium]